LVTKARWHDRTAIVLYPSGDPAPSQADIHMIKAIVEIATRLAFPCTITSSWGRTGMRV
jgi:DNA repair protein RadC